MIPFATEILSTAGFVFYLPSLFGKFLFDDEDFVYANLYVKNFNLTKFFTENAIAGRGKLSNYYRPVQLTLYALIHKLFGFPPFFFHLFNILFHILASILAYKFLLKLTKQQKISFLAALFFLIHPVQTESVSYVSGLSDPLFTSFLFLSLIFYLKFRDSQNPKNYFLHLLFFILSFLSKELGLVIIPLIVLIELFFKKEKINERLPFIGLTFFIGILYLLLRFSILQFQDVKSVWLQVDKEYANNILVRIFTFLNLFPEYIKLLFLPINLHMERDYGVKIIKTINFRIIAVLVSNSILIGTLWLYRKRKSIKLSLFYYLSFLVSLSPFSGIFLINGLFYEHYLYLPLLFFFGFLFSISENFLKTKVSNYVVGFTVVILFILSVFRQYEWIDPERFYKQTLKYAPKSIRILNNLGMTLADKEKFDEAIFYYKKALKIDFKNPVLYHNLGNAYASKGEYKKAEEYYLKAVQINPNFIFSYQALFQLYKLTGQKQKAQELLKSWRKIRGDRL